MCDVCASSLSCESCAGDAIVYKLTNASTLVTQADGLELSVALGKVDVDAITTLSELATNKETTHVAVRGSTIDDMAGNNVAQQISQVDLFIFDKTSPALVQFELDLTKEWLTLSFTETVNASSLNIRAIKILSAASAGATPLKLTGGMVVSKKNYSTSVTIKLETKDLNAIKAISMMATMASNTYISLELSSILDMAGNGINATVSDKAAKFTADGTKPVLDSFALDMNLTRLLLTFSETVNASTLCAAVHVAAAC
jgi:hypothetical protein